jgi:hypothetical protein
LRSTRPSSCLPSLRALDDPRRRPDRCRRRACQRRAAHATRPLPRAVTRLGSPV